MEQEQKEEMIQIIAKTIMKACQLREDSYDHKESDELMEKYKNSNYFPDFEKCYKLDLEDACYKASEENEIDKRFGRLIYLALDGWWNDTIIWANEILGICSHIDDGEGNCLLCQENLKNDDNNIT